MSEREWTKEELDDVWPLDKHGFAWGWNGRAWMASSEDCVCFPLVLDASAFRMVDDGAPLDVVLAVVAVALGLDSREAIAAAIEHRADLHREGDIVSGPHRVAALAKAAEAHDCAEMVRRGTVLP